MPHVAVTPSIDLPNAAQALTDLLTCHHSMHAQLDAALIEFVRADVPNVRGVSWDVESSYDDEGGTFTTIETMHASMADGRLVHLANQYDEWPEAIEAQIDEETDALVKASLETLLVEGSIEECMHAQAERMQLSVEQLEQFIDAVRTLAYMDTSTTDLTFQTAPVTTGEAA